MNRVFAAQANSRSEVKVRSAGRSHKHLGKLGRQARRAMKERAR